MALREILVELGFQVDDRSRQRANAAVQGLKKLALVGGVAFAAGGMALRRFIDDASEASETANKFAAIFGDASDDVQKSLDDTAKRTGQSTMELQQFAAQIGAVTKPALKSADAAGEIGARMAEAALDVASFNDVEPSEALAAIRSGLIGSTEPLIRFGVDLRKATLEQDRMRLGFNKSVDDMSRAEITQLRAAAIIDQLGDANQDATKTANGYANAMRGLRGRLKEASATIGMLFLPNAEETVVILRDIVGSVVEWIKANEDMLKQRVAQALQFIKGVARGLVTSIKTLVQWYKSLTSRMTELQAGLFKVGLALTALIVALGLPAVLLGIIALTIALIIDDLDAMGRGADSVSGRMVKAFGDMEIGARGLGVEIKEFLATPLEELLELFGLNEKKARLFSEALVDFKLPIVSTMKQIETLQLMFEKMGDALDRINKSLGKFLAKSLIARGLVRHLAEGLVGPEAPAAQLGVPELLRAPATPEFLRAPTRAITTSLTNEINVQVDVDAPGATDPQALGTQLSRGVEGGLERPIREASQKYKAAVAGVGP